MMTDGEKITALTEALEMAQTEILTLIPRVSSSYAKNLQGAYDHIKVTLKAVKATA